MKLNSRNLKCKKQNKIWLFVYFDVLREAFLSKLENTGHIKMLGRWLLCISEHLDSLVGRDMPWEATEVSHSDNNI